MSWHRQIPSASEWTDWLALAHACAHRKAEKQGLARQMKCVLKTMALEAEWLISGIRGVCAG